MELFRRSITWVIDYRYDGHPRRRFQILDKGVDAERFAREWLRDTQPRLGTLVEVRRASADEEREYLRGEEARNAYCPTGRAPSGGPLSGEG
jgi:hypothetical protein